MATPLKANEINDTVLAAIQQINSRGKLATDDSSLGMHARAIADSYESLEQALVNSPRPFPAYMLRGEPMTPERRAEQAEGQGAKTQTWEHRQPLLQAWADAIATAIKGIRAGNGDAACEELASTQSDLQTQLAVGPSPAESAIKLGDESLPAAERQERQLKKQFSEDTERYQRLFDEARGHAEFDAGQARAKARSGGKEAR